MFVMELTHLQVRRPPYKVLISYYLQWVEGTVSLGRVYVEDPDDWDSMYKRYAWRTPHPSFHLDSSSGLVTMLPRARAGRYAIIRHLISCCM